MVQSKEHILSIIQSNSNFIKQLGAKRIGIFGSYLHHQQSSNSDIDLMIEFADGKKTFSNYTGLYNFLTDLFKQKIDFITPESLSPYLGEKILKDVHYVSFS